MENQTTPCKALVLAGGGARGSYQVPRNCPAALRTR